MVKLSEKEKAAHKAAFEAMSPAQKAEHIFTYHKWTILLILLTILVLGSIIHRQLTQKKPVLYLAVINAAFGEDVEKGLTEDFLVKAGFDTRRQEVYLYRDLYLSENADALNHEYAYASKVKLSGAISAEKLDLVLMNRDAYDIFSRQGYLMELPSHSDALSPYVTENEVILSDNSVDYLLGNAAQEQIVTKTVPNALIVSSLPLFRDAGFDGDLYLGVISNSPRQEEAEAYFQYIFGFEQTGIWNIVPKYRPFAAIKKENGKPLFLGLPVFQVKGFLAIFTIS